MPATHWLNNLVDAAAGPLATFASLAQWLITLIGGGAWQLATQMLITGLSTGVQHTAGYLAVRMLGENMSDELSNMILLPERLRHVRALMPTSDYTAMPTELRRRVERQTKAAQALLDDIEASARRRVLSGGAIAMLNDAVLGAWEDSRGAARRMWGKELSGADESNMEQRAGAALFATPGQVKQLNELEAALMRTHHDLLTRIDARHDKTRPAGEELEDAVAPAQADVNSPPLLLGEAIESWQNFMENFSERYRTPRGPVSMDTRNDPKDIRVAYETFVYAKNNNNAEAATRDILEEMLRVKFTDYRAARTGTLAFSDADIEQEIRALRSDPIALATVAAHRQYQTMDNDGALVVLPATSRQAAVTVRDRNNAVSRFVRPAAMGSGGALTSQLELPAEVALASSSAVLALTEMAFHSGDGTYYNVRARRAVAWKPVYFTLATLFVAGNTVVYVANNRFGFDLSQVGKSGGIPASRAAGEREPELKKLLKAFSLLSHKSIIDKMTPDTRDKWNAWYGKFWLSPDKTYASLVDIADFTAKSLKEAKSRGQTFDAATKDLVNEVIGFNLQDAWVTVSGASAAKELDAKSGWGEWALRTGDNIPGVSWLTSQYTYAQTVSGVTSRLLTYANWGFWRFAVHTFLLSLIIDIAIEVVEGGLDVPIAGVDRPSTPRAHHRSGQEACSVRLPHVPTWRGAVPKPGNQEHQQLWCHCPLDFRIGHWSDVAGQRCCCTVDGQPRDCGCSAGARRHLAAAKHGRGGQCGRGIPVD